MKVVGKQRATAAVTFNRSEAQKLLNAHWLGQENCNVEKDGKFVPIEHPNMSSLEKAHYKYCENQLVKIEADVFEDGSFANFRVVE